MLLMAAGVEAYWSSSSLPASVKRSVGACMLVAVSLYLGLVGRGGTRQPRKGPGAWT
jgi:hypothetical protein